VTGVDDGSFEAFVAEWSTTLLRTAYLLTGDRGHAVDLLQTALITSYRHWSLPTDPEDAAAVALRAIVATHTSWRRRLQLGELLAESPVLSGLAGLPGFALPASDPGRRSEIGGALRKLAPRTRAVLVLRYGEDLSEAATAEALDCAVDVVAADTQRGLAQLQELLGDAAGTTGAGTDIAGRLRNDLAAQARQITAAPDADQVLAEARSERRHRMGLLAALAFVVVVAVLVLLSLR
jgi:DNA-directed RNA polymerase specialized sigma24 family protein